MTRRIVANPASSNRIRVIFDHEDSTVEAALESVDGLAADSRAELIEATSELSQLIGLEKVKAFIYEIYALLIIYKKRQALGLKTADQVLHMIFKGNPGTGKTTVARLLGKIFNKMGVLSKGHLIEVERADLVGEYIGHTALKTREHVKKALGGILFIDEAYSLARGGEKDFGKEAIDTLVKSMEDHKNEFILILAGYSAEMDQFLLMNPGLPSRFPIQLMFEDYSVEQLMEIAHQMLRQREYRMSPAAAEKMRQHLIQQVRTPFHSFSNARYIRNMIEKAIRRQAVRLLSAHTLDKDVLMTLESSDYQFGEQDR